MYRSQKRLKAFFDDAASKYFCAVLTFFVAMFVTLLAASIGTPVDITNADIREEIEFNVYDTLSIQTDSSFGLHITPKTGGTFTYSSVPISISTNDPSGYQLIMSTNESGNGNSLVNTESSSTRIPTIDRDITVTASNYSSFTSNSWGYTVANNLDADSNSSTTFSPIPTSINPKTISQVSNATSGNVTDVTFAVNVAADFPSGIYSNTVFFSAIVNMVPVDEEDPEDENFFTIEYMQEMTADICNRATTPTIKATQEDTTGRYAGNADYVPTIKLIDKRDNSLYLVRKLADGNCWMITNLQITGPTFIYSNLSDMESGSFYLPRAKMSNSASGHFTNAVDNNQIGEPSDWYGLKSGRYYSWYTATAGSGAYKNKISRDQEATSSICPKNWQLPTHDGDKSLEQLLDGTYGDGEVKKYDKFPLDFIVQDRFGVQGLYFPLYTSSSYFWTNTAWYYDSPYYAQIGANFAGVSSSYAYYGHTIRCVARDGTTWPNKEEWEIEVDSNKKMPERTSSFGTALSDAGAKYVMIDDQKYYTMQQDADVNKEVCDAIITPVNFSTGYEPEITMIDTRDNNQYKVRKLADGNCWMVENLRLKLTAGQTLTSSDTDVESFTAPYSTQTSSQTAIEWGTDGDARSYDTGNGMVLYNWYAATAGGLGSNEESYSICPKGWQMPNTRLTTSYKTWENLVLNAYNVSNSSIVERVERFVFSAPLDLVLTPFYHYSAGLLTYDDSGPFAMYWSINPSDVLRIGRRTLQDIDYTVSLSGTSKYDGLAMRCVMR